MTTHAISVPVSPASDFSLRATAARLCRETRPLRAHVTEPTWQRPLAIALPLAGPLVTLAALLAVALLVA